MFSEIKIWEVATLPGDKNGLGEKVLRSWADSCLLKDINPLQKRLFDWWTGEGFFNVSNFKETPHGMSAELMLMMGENAYGMVRNGSEHISVTAIEAKKKQGWEMTPFGTHYLLKDTRDNRSRIEALLEENIRNYRLINFTKRELDSGTMLKSVIVEIYKKR